MDNEWITANFWTEQLNKQYFGYNLRNNGFTIYTYLYINQVIPETENGEPCVL